jgi:hypothetical protein
MFGTNFQNCPRAFPIGGWPLEQRVSSAMMRGAGNF